jgi:hypothetical protein
MKNGANRAIFTFNFTLDTSKSTIPDEFENKFRKNICDMYMGTILKYGDIAYTYYHRRDNSYYKTIITSKDDCNN